VLVLGNAQACSFYSIEVQMYDTTGGEAKYLCLFERKIRQEKGSRWWSASMLRVSTHTTQLQKEKRVSAGESMRKESLPHIRTSQSVM
jgi:hypothetical protein